MSMPESAPVGSVLGRIWANDRDVGVNAEMTYSIIDGDGRDTFEISTDPTNTFGIITVKKVGRTQREQMEQKNLPKIMQQLQKVAFLLTQETQKCICYNYQQGLFWWSKSDATFRKQLK